MKNKIKFYILIMFIYILTMPNIVNAVEELPDNGAKISSAQVIQTKTGTGPWDDNDEPGNDSSENNNIVRSFDQVTWTIENTMVLNNSIADSYTGGKIYFEAILPDMFKDNLAKWDIESMKWISNAQISEDGLMLTGYYQMGNTGITVPGKQTLIFVAKILGVANRTEFTPTIRTWLNGNSSNDYIKVNIDKTIVSAMPKYNIKFARNTRCAARTTLNVNGKDITGRVYGYYFILQLYNEDISKGLKGIEYPKGKITFDIDLSFLKKEASSSELLDITNSVTPLLWNYQINNIYSSKGSIPGRTMFEGRNYTIFSERWGAPFGIFIKNSRSNSIFNSGNVSMVQNGNKINVTISDYDFDGTFPGYAVDHNNNWIFKDNVGCFNSTYFQILVPDYDEYYTNTNYYLKLNDNNFHATSLSNIDVTSQIITNDDSTNVQYVKTIKGTYNEYQDLHRRGKDDILGRILQSHWSKGDGYAYNGQKIYYRSCYGQDVSNDEDVIPRRINALVKLDAECFEPDVLSNGAKFQIENNYDIKFNLYYVTKKDGTNWSSQQEMINASVEDVIAYENYSDIPEGWECTGVWLESYDGIMNVEGIFIDIPFTVKSTAKVGKTYGISQKVWYWSYPLDIQEYTILNSNVVWPTDWVFCTDRDYIKTEYDENGVQIPGTHNGNHYYGQTLLIVGAHQKVAINTIDINNKNKTNYDLGKNENTVIYKITPTLENIDSRTVNIDGVTVTVTDTLPNGLTYVPGSSNYGDPEVTENDDGSSTLVWKIYNCTVGKAIEPITFDASIYAETSNGTQYENKAVISADNDIIGNTEISLRTATNTIQVTNLSSHRLYKTMNTPVIEKNGEIHFTLSYKNNTDDTIPDFQLLDILPYNGDGRGTEFTGTYTLDRVVVSKEDVTTRAAGDMQVLYTNSESARRVTSKDENLGSDWTEVTSENIKQNATAIVVKGEVEAQGKVNVDVYLKTSDNKGLDKYVNSATAQVYKATEEMTTSSVVSQVVERTIEGIAWEDVNANGIKDENEEVLQNIELTLTDSLGNQVTDVNGNIVESVRTDSNGYYKFVNLPKGNYYISVAIFNSDYEITEKETGTNSQINSKFNVEAKETDEITKLNSIDLPILTMSNVNVGFVKKATSIVIKHVTEEGINLSEPQTVEGRVDDKYETQDRASEFKEYELKITPSNANGTMQAEQIEVVYVYSLVKGKITITKVDKNDETKTLSGATFKVEKLNEDNTIDTTFTAIEKTTEESGIAEFTELTVGKYRITETKAPAGYELAKNSIEVEITKEQRELNVKATDRLKLILPETGGKGIIVFTISGIILMSLVLILKNIKLMKVKN